nr:hypothetical protein pmam_353 [Pithovirus mammoth]
MISEFFFSKSYFNIWLLGQRQTSGFDYPSYSLKASVIVS